MKLKVKKIKKYKDLKGGELFIYDGTLALVSDYTVPTRPDILSAYIVGSGEVFWGGCKGVDEREELLVTVVKLKMGKKNG